MPYDRQPPGARSLRENGGAAHTGHRVGVRLHTPLGVSQRPALRMPRALAANPNSRHPRPRKRRLTPHPPTPGQPKPPTGNMCRNVIRTTVPYMNPAAGYSSFPGARSEFHPTPGQLQEHSNREHVSERGPNRRSLHEPCRWRSQLSRCQGSRRKAASTASHQDKADPRSTFPDGPCLLSREAAIPAIHGPGRWTNPTFPERRP